MPNYVARPSCFLIALVGLYGCVADRSGFAPRGGTGTPDAGVFEPCETNPCANGGDCEVVGESYECDCSSTDFEGERCEISIDDCQDVDCQNGGTCIDEMRSFSCECAGPWAPDPSSGLCTVSVATCEDLNPCLHSGRCIDIAPGTVQCDCRETGYEGDFCQTDRDECKGDPCKHGGVCLNEPGSYSCNCEGTGYFGRTCGKDINECDRGTDTCDPFGTEECENEPGGFECDCHRGYTGRDCDECEDGYVPGASGCTRL